jgi:hypothetical protein
MIKHWQALGALAALVLTGCGKDKPEPGKWVGEEKSYVVEQTKRSTRKDTAKGQGATVDQIKPTIKPEVPVPKLATLQVNGPGWRSTFNKDANVWYLDKDIVVSDFGAKRQIRVTVVRSPVEVEPATLAEYTKFLHDRPDEEGFVWPQVVESGNLPDGFYIVGKVRSATDVTARVLDTGLCVVRTIGGDRLRFKCIKLPSELQAEALEMCRGARF